MKVLRRKRRLAGPGPGLRHPGVSRVVASWGDNSFGQLGNGLGANTSGPVQVTNMGGATQVAAGQLASYAVHTVLVLGGQSS